MQFNKNSGKGDEKSGLWGAYCAFHLGDYKAALQVCTNVVVDIVPWFNFLQTIKVSNSNPITQVENLHSLAATQQFKATSRTVNSHHSHLPPSAL